MKIVIGLGNPGQKYKNTRHNIGFFAIDRLIKHWQATGPNKKNNGSIYNASLFNQKIILVKPETFMNRSGMCVAPLFNFYKLNPDDIIIIHDDIDIPPLTLRIKKGGGTGGHNGLKSINEYIGSENSGYHRVRIGVGRPENKYIEPAEWVLQQFTKDETNKIDEVLDKVVSSVELIVIGKSSEAMNLFNRKDV